MILVLCGLLASAGPELLDDDDGTAVQYEAPDPVDVRIGRYVVAVTLGVAGAVLAASAMIAGIGIVTAGVLLVTVVSAIIMVPPAGVVAFVMSGIVAPALLLLAAGVSTGFGISLLVDPMLGEEEPVAHPPPVLPERGQEAQEEPALAPTWVLPSNRRRPAY